MSTTRLHAAAKCSFQSFVPQNRRFSLPNSRTRTGLPVRCLSSSLSLLNFSAERSAIVFRFGCACNWRRRSLIMLLSVSAAASVCDTDSIAAVVSESRSERISSLVSEVCSSFLNLRSASDQSFSNKEKSKAILSNSLSLSRTVVRCSSVVR